MTDLVMGIVHAFVDVLGHYQTGVGVQISSLVEIVQPTRSKPHITHPRKALQPLRVRLCIIVVGKATGHICAFDGVRDFISVVVTYSSFILSSRTPFIENPVP